MEKEERNEKQIVPHRRWSPRIAVAGESSSIMFAPVAAATDEDEAPPVAAADTACSCLLLGLRDAGVPNPLEAALVGPDMDMGVAAVEKEGDCSIMFAEACCEKEWLLPRPPLGAGLQPRERVETS